MTHFYLTDRRRTIGTQSRSARVPINDFLMILYRSLPFMALIILLVGCCCYRVEAQARKTAPAAASREDFEKVKEEANQAREGGRFEEAISLYRKATAIRPGWTDGWWLLATLLYDSDQYAEAARAFKQTSTLQPKVGAPWVMLGLCEFRLGDYDNSYKHIQQGRQVGISENKELSRVVRYHEGMLLLLKGEFETAQKIFGTLSYENMNNEGLFIAHGLASLRLAMIPAQIKPDYRDRDLIRRIGFAEHQMAQANMGDAQIEFDRLVADYAKTPGVQYAFGRYLLTQRNDGDAIKAFQREIENSPNHALARLQLAYIRLRNKDVDVGLPLAQEAVKLHPRLPLGHYVLGRLFFDSGDNVKAIEELEHARKLSPNEARIHFALSRAYAKAGRKVEAERARATFARLNKQAEEAAAQGIVRRDAIEEGQEKARTDPPQ
jgi:tetratricopeptide (TPR) repeat protein